MFSYVTGVVAQICVASDREGLISAIQLGLADIDLTTFNLSCNKHSKVEYMTEPTLTTWSGLELEKYVSERWYERDPLLDHAASNGNAKFWTSKDWQDSDEFGDYAEFLDFNNILSVITVPLVGAPVTISAFTATSDLRSNWSSDAVAAVEIIGQTGMLRAQVLGLVESASNSSAPDVANALSAPQLEILGWARQGKTNGEIALITGRSKRTVAYHISEILRKLGVSTRTQAIAIYTGK